MRIDAGRADRINTIWNSADFTGDQRPCTRITIQKVRVKYHYTVHRLYRSVLFDQPNGEFEIPTVKSVQINRSVNQDAGSCTITLDNNVPIAVGDPFLEQRPGEVDQPGYLTFNRGTSPSNARWGYDVNAWVDFIVPDRFIRTYQGYGQDLTKTPRDDTNLMQTGIWLIDDVQINTDGTIALTCRDLAGLLIDQHVYPPIVPPQHYPLVFQPYDDSHPSAQTPTRQNVDGNYGDYVDIVKQLSAIGGFYWSADQPYDRQSVAGTGTVSPTADPGLYEAGGRCWGDFVDSGTTAVAPIPSSVFDKQPLIDGITYVKEILGYNWSIDEWGGVIFRPQNIWRQGNYTVSEGYTDRSYTSTMLTIDERIHLKSYGVKLSNANKRDLITVGTVDGRYRAQIKNNEEIPPSQRPLHLERHAIWTDQNFVSDAECKRMAEFIRIRLKQQYRVGQPTIPANPTIQIDDQVRVIERQTGEGYVHYVGGYTSTWDRDAGTWDMNLETYWLGVPGTADYAANTAELSSATITVLEGQGAIPANTQMIVAPNATLREDDGTEVTVTATASFPFAAITPGFTPSNQVVVTALVRSVAGEPTVQLQIIDSRDNSVINSKSVQPEDIRQRYVYSVTLTPAQLAAPLTFRLQASAAVDLRIDQFTLTVVKQ